VWAVLRLPLLICFGAFTMNRMIFLSFLVQPLTARLWRARRLLADAISVQLTRQATPFADALTRVTGWAAARSIERTLASRSRPTGSV
jgi:Zn-dependent protease with chaperone function